MAAPQVGSWGTAGRERSQSVQCYRRWHLAAADPLSGAATVRCGEGHRRYHAAAYCSCSSSDVVSMSFILNHVCIVSVHAGCTWG